MSELKNTLVNISEEVRTKVIPENIKAGVQIFDVVGSYEGEREYERLAYLEATGKQCFQIDFKATNKTKVVIEMYNETSGNYNLVHGISFGFKMVNNQYRIRYYDDDVTYDTNYPVVIGKRVKIQFGKGGLYVNDNLAYQLNDVEFTARNYFTLFGYGTPGDYQAEGTYSGFCPGRLYYCEIYENDTLVRNLIPVKRLEDNVICLYDLVTKQYYFNLGTEDCIAGYGYLDTSDATATSEDIVEGKTAYVNGEIIQGTFKKGVIYSVDEIVIGKWINGKDLYRKVIVLPNGVGGATEKSGKAYNLSDWGIYNVDEIYTGTPSFYTHINDTQPFNYNDGEKYSVSVDPTVLTIAATYDYIAKSRMVITLEYTKTTDVATIEI